MRKLILTSLLVLTLCFPAYALLVTDNVDRDNFQYEIPYQFATTDLGASLTAVTFSVSGLAGSGTAANPNYVIPRSGRIVGIAVSGNAAITAGGATFDVTINGTVTGVQTVIESPARSAVGNTGSSGTQFAYMRQDRADTAASRGFKASDDSANFHNADNPFGKATALSAGNRVGVRVTTSSTLSPTTIDYVVTVYVLE